MDNSNSIKVLGAVVVGAVVGATLGVLFAPDKGCRTRSKLVRGVRDMAGDLQDKLINQVDVLRSKANKLEELASAKISDLNNSIK